MLVSSGEKLPVHLIKDTSSISEHISSFEKIDICLLLW